MGCIISSLSAGACKLVDSMGPTLYSSAMHAQHVLQESGRAAISKFSAYLCAYTHFRKGLELCVKGAKDEVFDYKI